jgi:serine/threonine-protein kinase
LDTFELGPILGAGGGGIVYHAYDRVLERPVALKLLHAHDQHRASRLVREARAQASVQHPNVVSVYGVGVLSDRRAFIAMQLVEGTTLTAVFSRMTLRERVQVAAQVADGLAAAHARGLVHRDVKPCNILVQRRAGAWHALIADFGVAGPSGLLPQGVVGTPQYMAPEQLVGGDVTPLMDVYGLGAVLYHLITGVMPFDGATPQSASSWGTRRPTPVRAHAPSVPRDLELIVHRCMRVDPGRRFPSMVHLRDDLTRWLDGEPVSVRKNLE